MMTIYGYQEEMNKIFRYFPDYSWSVLEGRTQESADGIVVAALCCERRTHTGEPYTFGPYPEIPFCLWRERCPNRCIASHHIMF